jgi:hypothetical protein
MKLASGSAWTLQCAETGATGTETCDLRGRHECCTEPIVTHEFVPFEHSERLDQEASGLDMHCGDFEHRSRRKREVVPFDDFYDRLLWIRRRRPECIARHGTGVAECTASWEREYG